MVAATRERVRAGAEEAVRRPKLTSLPKVLESLAPEDPEAWRKKATEPIDRAARQKVFGSRLPEKVTTPTRRTMASHINHALHDEMIRRPEIVVFGEDVGRKGGVYGVTQRLQERFGEAHCFDTLLDETTILGVAQGAAQAGLLPIPEVPYLAYLHNAIDQLRGRSLFLAVLFRRAILQPDGGAHRRARLPKRLWRPLPQRQFDWGPARNPRLDDGGAGPGGRRGKDFCGGR